MDSPSTNPSTRVAVARDHLHVISGAWFDAAWAEIQRQQKLLWPHPVTAALAVWSATERQGGVEWRVDVRPHSGDAPIALTFGAHTRCDFARIPGASLRHAIAIAWPPTVHESGSVEVLDLRSASGIAVPADAEESFSDRAGIGNASVFFLQACEGAEIQRPAWTATQLRRKRRNSRQYEGATRVASSRVARYGDVTRAASCSGVKLMNNERASLLAVGDEAWREGVLLGRYDRCQGQLSHDRISRVHAVLLERRDERWIIDCGSTNGTVVHDIAKGCDLTLEPARRVAKLPPLHRIHLGDALPLSVVPLSAADRL